MPDVVVTVPKDRWEDWIAEGDAAGEPWSGEEWHFYLAGQKPQIAKGERVYIVAHGKLRGYAPLIRIEDTERWDGYALVRRGGAVAITVPEHIVGFRGWRYRWWKTEDERPFPNWRKP